MSNNISKNILSTIAYYDVLDYPMTSFEIWKYLIRNSKYEAEGAKQGEEETQSLADVARELENNQEIKKHISEFQGFYFLRGRENLIGERIEKNKISENKIEKARKISFWLEIVPFIKMVAITGRVGAKNAKAGSDIDMLIVFEKGKIFTGRFLATALVHFFGQRRHGKKITNRICFNHFLSDEFFVSVQDLYSSHNYVFMTLLFGVEFFPKFLEKNQWIREYRPNFVFLENNSKETRGNRFFFWIRRFLEIIFASAWIEKWLREWQIKKIEKNPLTKKPGRMIIYNDYELAFWPDFENQGPKVFEEFQKNLEKIKNNIYKYKSLKN